jgi:hypothetical protein
VSPQCPDPVGREARLSTRRGESRGFVRCWRSPLDSGVEYTWVKSHEAWGASRGTELAVADNGRRFAAWLSQRRWELGSWEFGDPCSYHL